jgi:hypothetical protein
MTTNTRIDPAAYRQALEDAWRIDQALRAVALRLATPLTGTSRQAGKGPWEPEVDFIWDLMDLSVVLSSRIGGEANRLGMDLPWHIPADGAARTD